MRNVATDRGEALKGSRARLPEVIKTNTMARIMNYRDRAEYQLLLRSQAAELEVGNEDIAGEIGEQIEQLEHKYGIG